MDWVLLSNGVDRDRDYPERTWRLDCLTRVLEGSLYDHLPHAFSEERTEALEYIPLAKRRPSVRSNICRTVVDDSVSLLFSEGHFPAITATNTSVAESLNVLMKESSVNEVMLEAATRGAVGSIAIVLRVLKSRVFFEVLPTRFLTPAWDPEAPDTLIAVTERYKVRGDVLRETGYAIGDGDDRAMFWFQRTWDADAETWFLPAKLEMDGLPQPPMQIDTMRTVEHKLGFVPVEWVRNLPGGDRTDGVPTFAAAISTMIEIDYLLSQNGRGLKYSADPTLLIKEPASPSGDIVRSASSAIVVSAEGDAKMLEIGGTAAAAVIEHVRYLREIALEAMHGNRSEASKLTAAQSGRAIELMNQGLIWIADRLRISYGERALLNLMRVVCRASHKYPLMIAGKKLRDLSDDGLALKWPRWASPTYSDLQQQATTLTTLKEGGILSRETTIAALADDYDIEDVPAEVARLVADEAAADERLAKQKAQAKANESVAT